MIVDPDPALHGIHGQRAHVHEHSHRADRVYGDAPAHRHAGGAVQHVQHGQQTQQSQEPEHRQRDGQQREQVVLEPPPAIVGQPQRDHIIDDEHHPDHVDDGFTQRDMRAGENFPRIHHQKHHGQHHQRPVRPLLPRLQSHIPIAVARPLRHCGA